MELPDDVFQAPQCRWDNPRRKGNAGKKGKLELGGQGAIALELPHGRPLFLTGTRAQNRDAEKVFSRLKRKNNSVAIAAAKKDRRAPRKNCERKSEPRTKPKSEMKSKTGTEAGCKMFSAIATELPSGKNNEGGFGGKVGRGIRKRGSETGVGNRGLERGSKGGFRRGVGTGGSNAIYG